MGLKKKRSWPNAATWPRAAKQTQNALRDAFRDRTDAVWKRLKDKVTAKRGKKCDAEDTTHKLLKRKELTVQRLYSEASGKAQKYARIGPREFGPFTEDELTIENIKRCCERHFATQVGTCLVCDFLAGQQGPYCKTLEQIPDMKVI